MMVLKKIAVLSMVRNNEAFASKWIQYYGAQFGFNNLYLFIDGMDQKLPELAAEINCFKLPHYRYKRSKADRKRAKLISNFATQLFESYEVVLAMDIDEFLVLDPNINSNLKHYLSQKFNGSSLSALGIDVGQHPDLEQPINWDQPLLSQRAFAQVSDRYTKPIIAFKPLKWGSGFHRIKGKNFKIDANLYLFHLGLIDIDYTQDYIKKSALHDLGWGNHFERRKRLYTAIQTQKPLNTAVFFNQIRTYFSKHRKWYAWNKPAAYHANAVIKIPKRFKQLI